MSPVEIDIPEHHGHEMPPVLRLDTTRGTWAMALFVTTEAVLFLCLFMAYYYIEKGNQRWLVEEPPRLHYAMEIFGVLIASSVTMWWGQRKIKDLDFRTARLSLIATIALALGSLPLTWFEITEELAHVTPKSDAYGSIFFTIDGLHVCHLVLGILMLFWLLFLSPGWEPRQHQPHRPYLNVAIYWHFVVALWVAVLAILYIAPNVYNAV